MGGHVPPMSEGPLPSAAVARGSVHAGVYFPNRGVKKNATYPKILRPCDIVRSETEIIAFPWYCIYRDIPLKIILIKKKKEKYARHIEVLENLKGLFLTHPSKVNYFLSFYRKISCKNEPQRLFGPFRIRRTTRWYFSNPERNGGSLLLSRLQLINQRYSWSQLNYKIRILKNGISTFEQREFFNKHVKKNFRSDLDA